MALLPSGLGTCALTRQHSALQTPAPGWRGGPCTHSPLHTRRAGQAARCVRLSVHAHAHVGTLSTGAPAVFRLGSRAGRCTPRSTHPWTLGPRGLSQLLSSSHQHWPHLRRGSTGLYRGSSRCSNHSHEQGHQELGTGDKHRPSRPAAFMAGVPVRGTRKLCSWPAGGPQRAETGGLSPGPEKVWGNLPSQKAVLPSQREACGDMQCAPCSH